MLPKWSRDLIDLYESGAATQFVLHGNVNDRLVLPLARGKQLGGLNDFLLDVLLSPFDVVLSYDLGFGLRVERGGERFAEWPSYSESKSLPNEPREAMAKITHYFRFCSNVRKMKGSGLRVAVIIKAAHLVIPSLQGGLNYDLNAMALLVREWATDSALTEHGMASFLISENLNDLHPLIVNNPRVEHVKVPLPEQEDIASVFAMGEAKYSTALKEYIGRLDEAAGALTGATLSAIEALLKIKEHAKEPLVPDDLADLKRDLVERDCQGLIEFVEPDRTLDDLYGQEAIKEWIREDISLWNQGDLKAMPMGYLFCGPVGTGKTYMVECLAGEAGVPVVKFKNFRDKWVGSTEGNLEKIFRLLQALGRCVVFIDEADQALGRRGGGDDSSGVSGRVYGMMAKEMSNSRNRGKILWILASSRPDLIEVDLKRPGRVDVKIPIFPSTTPEEGFFLIRALCKKQSLDLPKSALEQFKDRIPLLITPGAAEALSVKIYRMVKTRSIDVLEALSLCLTDYQNPVPEDVIRFQIGLAVEEATDISFVPEIFRE